MLALTDTFVKNVKADESVTGQEHTDGQGLFLHVKPAGKYWRISHRFSGKQRTVALGVYPAITSAKGRQRRKEARTLVATGIDHNIAKNANKQANAAARTFEGVARDWLAKTAAEASTGHQDAESGYAAAAGKNQVSAKRL